MEEAVDSLKICVCGIVEKGSKHTKKAEGVVGSKPGLETVPGLGCHCLPGQAVPFTCDHPQIQP